MGEIEVGGVEVEVVRKAIRRVYLRVYPPDGHVRVTLPYGVSERVVRKMVQEKLEWIKRHRERVTKRAMLGNMSVEEETKGRNELKKKIPELLEKWQPIMGVKATAWGVKKMKSRWGSCNVKTGRIWINLELSKKSEECLEYIVVHELAHLLEPSHNHRFKAFMDRFLPTWRNHRAELKG
jgi:predicted metal-dependent hydrolase